MALFTCCLAYFYWDFIDHFRSKIVSRLKAEALRILHEELLCKTLINVSIIDFFIFQFLIQIDMFKYLSWYELWRTNILNIPIRILMRPINSIWIWVSIQMYMLFLRYRQLHFQIAVDLSRLVVIIVLNTPSFNLSFKHGDFIVLLFHVLIHVEFEPFLVQKFFCSLPVLNREIGYLQLQCFSCIIDIRINLSVELVIKGLYFPV